MSDSGNIICKINGKEITLPSGTTLEAYLAGKNVKPAAVVVEHNREILPKGQYEGILLSDGDILEIVQVIGGG